MRGSGPTRLSCPFRPTFALLFMAGITLLSGCGPGSSTSTIGQPTDVSAPKTGGTGVGSQPSGKAGAGRPDLSKMVSSIAGDRMSVIPSTVVLSKQLTSSPFRFAEIAKDAGIDFVHFSGMTEEKHFPTANGSGVAVFDYNNDGLLDIYFATATLLPLGNRRQGAEPAVQEPGREPFRGCHRCFRARFPRFLPWHHRRRHRQ